MRDDVVRLRNDGFTATAYGREVHRVSILDYVNNLPEWMRHPGRRCRGMDPDWFFGSDDMKGVCTGCPVRQPCLDWALDNNESGIWGGASERERKRMRSQRAISR